MYCYNFFIFCTNLYLLLLIDICCPFLIKRKFNSDDVSNIELRVKKKPKIISGKSIDIAEAPSMIIFMNLDSMCGGTILNSWTVVTAAHCLDPNKDVYYMTVRVGVTKIMEENAADYDVLYYEINPNYDVDHEFDCDIAIVFVVGPIQLGPRVKKALIVDNEEWLNFTHIPEFVVTGWGMIEQDGDTSELLMMTRLTLVQNDKCSAMHNGARITDNMFCLYGQGVTDTCRGDSGGGVIWRGQLVGIVSHGAGCAIRNKPSVYTNVYKFRYWIKTKIGEFHKHICDTRT